MGDSEEEADATRKVSLTHEQDNSLTSSASRPGKWKIYIHKKFIRIKEWLIRKKTEIHHDRSLDLLRQNVKDIIEYKFKELQDATDHFSTERLIHEDALHSLFTGHFTNQGIYALIKRLKQQKELDVQELLVVELRALAILRHPNIVKCIGWCSDFMVVHESMPNGTLYSHLHSADKNLPWDVRFNVALNLASAILFLHDKWAQQVLHRNITSKNVMLTSDFNAKLTSFMFAKFEDFGIGIEKTAMLKIPDHIKPQCIREGIVTKAFDIHSFGVVILEIATGQLPSDILEKLRDSTKHHLIAPDERLMDEFDKEQMKRLIKTGLSCSLLYGQTRPTMQEVMRYLRDGEPELNEHVEDKQAPDFKWKLEQETFDIGIPCSYDVNGSVTDSHRDLMKGIVTAILGKINSGARFEEIHKIIESFTLLMVKLSAPLSDWNLFAQYILCELKKIEICCTRYEEEVKRIHVWAIHQVEEMHAATIGNNEELHQRATQDIEQLDLTITKLQVRCSMLSGISSSLKSLNIVQGVTCKLEEELAKTLQMRDSLLSKLDDIRQKIVQLQEQH